MVIRYKQSIEEVEQNVRDLFGSYEAKGRTLENSTYNGELILKHLADKFMVDRVIDASFTNFRKAVAALHASNLLHWTKEPAKQIEKPQRVNDLNAQLDVAIRDARKQQSEAQVEADNEAVGAAIRICRTWNNYPHSKAAKEKAALEAEFNKQVELVRQNKQTAQGLLKSVKALKDSF